MLYSYSSMPGLITTQNEHALAMACRENPHSWFHGVMTRTKAEERLDSAPNGSFLIRSNLDTHCHSGKCLLTNCLMKILLLLYRSCNLYY